MQAYIRFEAAALRSMAWAESMGPLQEAGPRPLNGLLSAAVLTSPALLSLGQRGSRHNGYPLVSAMVAPTVVAGALHAADTLAHKHLVLREASSMWAGLSELLAALYDVRLVAPPSVQLPAEEVVTLLGALYEAIPVRRTSFLQPKKPADDRYLNVQRAVTDALHRFAEAIDSDLRPRWRRRKRRHGWQLWRPRPVTLPGIDVELLIQSAGNSASAQRDTLA